MNANIRTIGGSIGAALMASIVTSGATPSGLPREAGYTHGFTMLGGATVLALLVALAILAARRTHPATAEDLPHAEMGLVAGGTLLGADPK
nr:hypothetical protein [Pseudofrankia saprophytica]